jgi:hypothetical protein
MTAGMFELDFGVVVCLVLYYDQRRVPSPYPMLRAKFSWRLLYF